jgi:hypothetical protein
MNTFTDGQTYTFTDPWDEQFVWVRTNGVWVSTTDKPNREDNMVSALLAAFPDAARVS